MKKSYFLAALGMALIAATPAMAECGKASTYEPVRGEGGPLAATGERINRHALTAAHKTLPLGSYVRVRNQRTGRTIVVRINDRGPFVAGRIIDLTHGAKQALGAGGLTPVCISRIR